MKFVGNPSRDLGIEYHSFLEIPQDDGSVVVRYVLSKPITESQKSELSKYDNVRILEKGATYKYAPEIKYDVLYITESPDDSYQEEATEDFMEGEEITYDYDDPEEVLQKLEEEIKKDNFNSDRFSQVTGCIDQINNLVVIYKSLGEAFPELKELFDELIQTELANMEKLQSIKNSETTHLLSEEE